MISDFYINSEIPTTLTRMNAVPNKAALLKHGTTRVISNWSRFFPKSSEAVINVPIMGTITAFTFQSSSICNFSISKLSPALYLSQFDL